MQNDAVYTYHKDIHSLDLGGVTVFVIVNRHLDQVCLAIIFLGIHSLSIYDFISDSDQF